MIAHGQNQQGNMLLYTHRLQKEEQEQEHKNMKKAENYIKEKKIAFVKILHCT